MSREDLKSYVVRSALSLNDAWEKIASGINVHENLSRLPQLQQQLQMDCQSLNDFEAGD